MTDQTGVGDRWSPARGLYRFTILVGCLTLVLLMAGALVTSNEAGDSVPDWPLSFGRWLIDRNYFVANVRYEYSHRVIAGLVGFSTFAIAIWSWKTERRKWVTRLAFIAFAGVVIQALIGGIRVLFPTYKAAIAVPHALIAQSFFGVLVTLAVVMSMSWWNRTEVDVDTNRPSLRSLSTTTVGAILIQLVLGAGFRHQAFSIVPHILCAVVVASLVIWTAGVVYSRRGHDAFLRRPAATAMGLIVVQVILGVAAYVARLKSAGDPQPLEPMISLTVAHVVVGALLLATMVVLMLRCYRALARSREPVSESTGSSSIESTGRATA